MYIDTDSIFVFLLSCAITWGGWYIIASLDTWYGDRKNNRIKRKQGS